MQLVIDVPDGLYDQHRTEDDDNEFWNALCGVLSTSNPDRDEITIEPLRESPHNRPISPWTYGWEEGEPCPDCGHDTIRVHYVDVVTFHSDNGEFEYEDYHPADGFDPRILWQCDHCYARLKETVPGTYFE